MSESNKGPELTYYPEHAAILGADRFPVAHLLDLRLTGMSQAERKANIDALGRKMAAAPELVEVVREMIAEAGQLGHDGYHENPLHGDTITKALALLEKAGVKL